MKKLLILIAALYFIVLIFSRFYNLGYTARFTEDESGFLVRVHEIYVERKITLVGQINDQGTKVFSSLSVYLLLPFAILGKFNPTSVFYGTAFFGVLAALSILYLSKLVNKKLLVLSFLLVLIWFPLVQTGRWAWNPNFIPLWIALGIICYLQKKPFFYFLAGIFLALSVHQHYYAIFGISIFILLVSIESILKRKFVNLLLINFGAGLTILPFLLFDLRHPPGIFLLGATNQANHLQSTQILMNIFQYSSQVLLYFIQLKVLIIPLFVLIVILTVFDIKQKSKSLIFLVPCIFQIILLSIVAPFFIHYFFVTIVFFFVWIFYPRKNFAEGLSIIIITLLIIGSAFTVKGLLVNSPVEPDLLTVNKITNLLEKETKSLDLKNVNIAVLDSPDQNTYGKKYRDIILVNSNIKLLTTDEYPITDNLFVVSTGSVDSVLKDKAFEVSSFRNGIVKNSWEVDNWHVYLLNKSNAKKVNR